MKILIVSTFYYPNMQGGAEQSVKLLAEGLFAKGHEVAVFTIDSKDGKNKVAFHNGIKIYRNNSGDFNLWKFSYEKNKVSKLEKVAQKLKCYCNDKVLSRFEKVCDDFKPDVIHSNTIYGISGMVWKRASKKNIPVVHTIRDIGIVSPVQYNHKVNKMILKAHQIYMRKYTGYVSGVTSPSDYTLRTSLEIASFKNAKVKKCIVNSVTIDSEAFRNIIKEKSGRTDKKIKFMYAGRLVYFKGIEHMIEAFNKMSYKNCELHICGTGEMENYTKKCAKKNSRIIYHGKLNNEQLDKVYDECDVMLVPSCWPEPFGRVVIEGNMHGMPVIAGNWGGIPEIIRQLKSGELYNAPSVDELALLLDKFTDRNVISSYYGNILDNMNFYGIDRQVDEFEKIYKSIQ